MKHFQIAVIGSGIVGLSAALGAARLNLTTALIAPEGGEPDGKTSALLGGSVDILKSLDVWNEAENIAFPLKTMRIIDGTNRLVRAPQTDFSAAEIGQTAFGYNIENKLLAEILDKACSHFANLTKIPKALETASIDNEQTTRLTLADGNQISANMVIAADGRNSVVRKSLNIGERTWQYPQLALVGNFTHSLPHSDVSTEFHTETGPFTLVPLGNLRSSMVCVVDEKTADHLRSMKRAELERHLEEKMKSILGKISMENDLKGFPLSGMVAKQFSSGPALLAGEAAHAFPPIGAQGLNLGLRDIKAALDLLASSGVESPGTLAEKYHSMRSSDILSRTASVDLLNRSLLTDFLPVQATRSLGLYAMGQIGPLRRFMMREGMAPGSGRKNPLESFAEKLKPGRSA